MVQLLRAYNSDLIHLDCEEGTIEPTTTSLIRTSSLCRIGLLYVKFASGSLRILRTIVQKYALTSSIVILRP